MSIGRTIVFCGAALLVVACGDAGDGATNSPGAGGASAGSPSMAGGTSAGSSGAPSMAGGGGGSSAGTAGSAVAGGGAATAGSGASGGSEPGPVMPVMRDGKWAFDAGEVTLEVDPMLGGRITSFKLGATNLLTGPEVNPTYWGSTLWTSPESQWTQPPPAPIDSDPYTAVATATTLTLTGMPYAMLGVSVTKTFSVDTALSAFKIEYELSNTQGAPIMMAPWEVTRVFPKGLTFFPSGSSEKLSNGATLATTKSDGITWFNYEMAAVTKDSKLYADAAEGWVAHVVDGLVFIKAFPDVAAGMIAPGEGDVELYVNAVVAAKRYIEIENQAAYGTIAAGASVTWPVTWYLRKLPQGVDGAAPNAALAKFVRDTVAGQ